MFPRLLILFVGIPLIELYLFLLIGSRIGLGATIATVILTGFLGAALTKRQGLQVLAKYQKALAEGRMPHAEVIEGLMILVAGAVLLTPGFLTDAIGFAMLIPPVRAVVRQFAGRYLKGRVNVSVSGMGVNVGAGNDAAAAPRSKPISKPPLDGPVIDVDAEVEVHEADKK
jgi:UPF0716 protein FxsA